MKSLRIYCNLIFVFLTSFTLLGQARLEVKKNVIIGNSYCENDILVIYADSQDKLTKGLKLCEDPTSVHLKLSPDKLYHFNDLKKFKKVRILTIEFPIYGENNIIFDGGTSSMEIIDCSFLSEMNDLEFLVIDWLGGVKNVHAICKLKNLIYSKLPVEAFQPALFSNTAGVFQYEFGDHFVLRKDGTKNDLEVMDFEYENYLNLSNRKIRKFRKKISKINEKGRLLWDNQLLSLSSDGDTLFYMTDKSLDTVLWRFNFPENKGFCLGRYSSGIINIETNYLSYERYLRFENEDQYSVKLKIKNSGRNSEYKQEKEVGYLGNEPHGTFAEYFFGQLEYKNIYNNGQLTYSCHGINRIPIFNIGSPIDIQINRMSARIIELFLEKKDTVLIRLYAGIKRDQPTQKVVELPLKNNKPNGEVILFYPNGDTTVIAEFQDGKLHGRYYSSHISYQDTLIEKAEYQNGNLSGDVIRTGGEFTTVEKYNTGRLLYRLVTRDNAQQKVSEMIWSSVKKYAETTFWSEDGKVIRVLRNDENGRVIYDREYPERMTSKEINYRP